MQFCLTPVVDSLGTHLAELLGHIPALALPLELPACAHTLHRAAFSPVVHVCSRSDTPLSALAVFHIPLCYHSHPTGWAEVPTAPICLFLMLRVPSTFSLHLCHNLILRT